ncbi:unnamed protein product [Tenebrio molitor]|nr:unnamed protein product [Tenebrio molitor]
MAGSRLSKLFLGTSSPLSLHHCGASLKDVSNHEPVYC